MSTPNYTSVESSSLPHHNGELNFPDITLQEVPVVLGDKRFILRECDEETAVKYRNMQSKATRFSKDGSLVAVEGLADTEPFLVARCLFEEGKDKPIGDMELKKLIRRPRIVRKLFDKIKEMSQLEEADEATLRKQMDLCQRRLAEIEEAKNLQSATTDTSE
jgi:hypothetical protein